MAVYIRLNDAARARLRGEDAGNGGCTSSGSDHDASACLSDLVQAFLETDAGAAEDGVAGPAPKRGGADSDSDEACDSTAASVRELLDPPAEEDVFRIRLAAAVSAAAEAEAALRAHGAAFRRALVRRLRAAGYDAGVCKSRWEASGGVTAGSYEYVDVVVAGAPVAAAGKKVRYIVDADFRAGLEVARATAEYAAVAAAVPAACVVAREENVGRAVRLASDAARRSLRAQGLHVPPWRKTRYMLAKWLGPYKRSTAGSMAANAGSMPMSGGAAEMDVVKCRAVGFFPPHAATAAARIK